MSQVIMDSVELRNWSDEVVEIESEIAKYDHAIENHKETLKELRKARDGADQRLRAAIRARDERCPLFDSE